MALELGIVGLPSAGKTSLFAALTGSPSASDYGKEHVGIAPIPDERLARVAEVVGSAKVTPATIRVLDAPALSPPALGRLRQADALVAVVDGYSSASEPARDLETIRLELLVADRDHVERRLERVRKQAKSGEARLREEVAQLEAVLAHLEAGKPLADWDGALPAELEPLTTKPVLELANGAAGIDLKLEAELAELPPDEAAAFREGTSALDEVVGRLTRALNLISFFTANESEARAWSLRDGQTALDAAATIHSDIARGFIRCEVISWSELVECGSRAEAARRGLQRLEGKGYVVEDGDVLQIRFNV